MEVKRHIPGPPIFDEEIIDKLHLDSSIYDGKDLTLEEYMKLIVRSSYLPDERKKLKELEHQYGEQTTQVMHDIIDWGRGPFGNGEDEEYIQSIRDRIMDAQKQDFGLSGFDENGNPELQLP
jgi:hypothetical protein